jgi:hypothetical protein
MTVGSGELRDDAQGRGVLRKSAMNQEKRAASCEVTRCSRTEILVRLAGIEPTTPWFVAKYSIQLSYSREALHHSKLARN